jgi:predicted short-subunit dehydrogenase-like oxidoreductase (DUF2520 family)
MISERPSPDGSLVAVVGRGRVGSALASALALEGIPVRLVPGRSPTDDVDLPAAGLIVLAVPDRAVRPVAAALGRRCGAASLRDRVVLHVSGSLGPGALGPASEQGAAVGGFHPLQTFPGAPDDAGRFRAAPVALDGDPAAVAAGHALALRLGCIPFVVAPGARPLYHLAAVLASNAVVAAGLPRDRALEALAPLARSALEAALTLGPERALTGPVARGDEETLERHRAALRAWDPERLALYEALIREQRRLRAASSMEKSREEPSGE